MVFHLEDILKNAFIVVLKLQFFNSKINSFYVFLQAIMYSSSISIPTNFSYFCFIKAELSNFDKQAPKIKINLPFPHPTSRIKDLSGIDSKNFLNIFGVLATPCPSLILNINYQKSYVEVFT